MGANPSQPKQAFKAAESGDATELAAIIRAVGHANAANPQHAIATLVNFRHSKGTPMLLAACRGNTPTMRAVVQLLLDSGAAAETTDGRGNTALHALVLASGRRKKGEERAAAAAVAELLLARGCPHGGGGIDCGRNHEGETALQLIARQSGDSAAPVARVLERHAALCSGWLFQQTDNFLSRSLRKVSGDYGGAAGTGNGLHDKLKDWGGRWFCVLPVDDEPAAVGAPAAAGALEMRLYSDIARGGLWRCFT